MLYFITLVALVLLSITFNENESYLRFGETVAVVGCGGVGLIVIAAARLRGAGEIYAIDNSTVKKDLSLNYGANFFHETVTNLPENIDFILFPTI